MSVNMSGFDKNPFKVGDKVRVKARVLSTFPVVFKNFLSVKYAIVTGVESHRVFTNVDDEPTHFEHFELYKESEEKDMNNQPKTKRVPFSVAAWVRHKDNASVYLNGKMCHTFLPMFNYQNDQGYALYQFNFFGNVEYHSVWSFEIEIPVTSKRIPFNPELKDAKVFYGDTELIEWVLMSSNVVCGVHTQTHPFKSLETALYHPAHLEMEIEE